VWQRGIAYKSFGPNVTSLEGLDVSKAAAMQEILLRFRVPTPTPTPDPDPDPYPYPYPYPDLYP
jgi:hypothetical protein